MKNLTTMSDLTSQEIYQLIERALEIKAGASVAPRKDLRVANLFFESSTRTKHSFEVAEQMHQLNIINFETSTSSVNKGETLYDTCKTLEMVGCNMLVIRHPEVEYYKELSGLNIPIMSGGDGSGEHPSQCLLDLMTMYDHFGTIEGLKVAIVGDIRFSRVAKSNYRTLTRLGATVYLVSPEQFSDESLGENYVLDDLLPELDVCMLLRLQLERHGKTDLVNKGSYHQTYGLTVERYEQLKDSAIIMHPAPFNRNIEIADEVVEAPKSVIFEQMKNGMFMRQAIIEYIIKQNQL